MELYNYQKEQVERMLDHYKNGKQGFGLFFEMGLGKTLTTLEFIKQTEPKSILIVCPKSIIEMWRWEFFKHVGSQYIFTQSSGKNVYIINYESLHTLDNYDWDVVILDECQKVKNYTTQAWKNVNKLKRNFTVCLSGTPITNTFMDIYSIMALIDKNIINMRPTQFDRYYIKDGGTTRTKQLYSKLADWTSFAKLTDHIDMPYAEDIIIPIQMNYELEHEYDQIYYANMMGLVKIRKLANLCLSTKGENNRRLTACDELIADILARDEQIVIFTTLTESWKDLMERYAEHACGIDGSTCATMRQHIVQEFTEGKHKIIICNTKVGGVGLNLQTANNVIYWGHDYELGALEQSKGRIYRIGQMKPCRYYHLQYLDTIDTHIYDCLTHKKNVIEELLKLYGKEEKIQNI